MKEMKMQDKQYNNERLSRKIDTILYNFELNELINSQKFTSRAARWLKDNLTRNKITRAARKNKRNLEKYFVKISEDAFRRLQDVKGTDLSSLSNEQLSYVSGDLRGNLVALKHTAEHYDACCNYLNGTFIRTFAIPLSNTHPNYEKAKVCFASALEVIQTEIKNRKRCN